MEHHQFAEIAQEPAIQLILIAESDHGVGQFLTGALAEADRHYRISWVTSAIDALKVTKFLTPSLFILDYALPDVNAVTLFDLLHMRKDLAQVPAIVLSTRLDGCEQELGRRNIIGLNLPLDLDDFLDTVEKALK